MLTLKTYNQQQPQKACTVICFSPEASSPASLTCLEDFTYWVIIERQLHASPCLAGLSRALLKLQLRSTPFLRRQSFVILPFWRKNYWNGQSEFQFIVLLGSCFIYCFSKDDEDVSPAGRWFLRLTFLLKSYLHLSLLSANLFSLFKDGRKRENVILVISNASLYLGINEPWLLLFSWQNSVIR